MKFTFFSGYLLFLSLVLITEITFSCHLNQMPSPNRSNTSSSFFLHFSKTSKQNSLNKSLAMVDNIKIHDNYYCNTLTQSCVYFYLVGEPFMTKDNHDNETYLTNDQSLIDIWFMKFIYSERSHIPTELEKITHIIRLVIVMLFVGLFSLEFGNAKNYTYYISLESESMILNRVKRIVNIKKWGFNTFLDINPLYLVFKSFKSQVEPDSRYKEMFYLKLLISAFLIHEVDFFTYGILNPFLIWLCSGFCMKFIKIGFEKYIIGSKFQEYIYWTILVIWSLFQFLNGFLPNMNGKFYLYPLVITFEALFQPLLSLPFNLGLCRLILGDTWFYKFAWLIDYSFIKLRIYDDIPSDSSIKTETPNKGEETSIINRKFHEFGQGLYWRVYESISQSQIEKKWWKFRYLESRASKENLRDDECYFNQKHQLVYTNTENAILVYKFSKNNFTKVKTLPVAVRAKLCFLENKELILVLHRFHLQIYSAKTITLKGVINFISTEPETKPFILKNFCYMQENNHLLVQSEGNNPDFIYINLEEPYITSSIFAKNNDQYEAILYLSKGKFLAVESNKQDVTCFEIDKTSLKTIFKIKAPDILQGTFFRLNGQVHFFNQNQIWKLDENNCCIWKVKNLFDVEFPDCLILNSSENKVYLKRSTSFCEVSMN